MTTPDDARLAVYLDFENLALGSRDNLRQPFDFKPVADAMAERGRVVVRRAYADWSYFPEERRELARSQVELIEIPQKIGGSRKNAADIKLAVDAIELAISRPWVDTFVFGTGDSDFTPLFHKLRELDRRVIAFGVRGSTSKLLPSACDEFLFYDDLVDDDEPVVEGEPVDLGEFVLGTLTGLGRSGSGPVRASDLKRALLRKDPTFAEADHGFRAWGELLRHLSSTGAITLTDDDVPGNPVVGLPSTESGEAASFELLRATIADRKGKDGWAPLSGLKQAMRQTDAGFTERALGYKSFLEFCRAAQARGLIHLESSDGQFRAKL